MFDLVLGAPRHVSKLQRSDVWSAVTACSGSMKILWIDREPVCEPAAGLNWSCCNYHHSLNHTESVGGSYGNLCHL